MAKGDYRHLDKDPVIDVIRTGFEHSPLDIYQVSHETYKHGRGVAVATIQNWLYGDTKRPQRYSLEAVLNALGIDMEFVWQATRKAIEVPNSYKRVPKSWMKQTWKQRKTQREAKEGKKPKRSPLKLVA